MWVSDQLGQILDRGFQITFRYGRVNLGIKDISDVANFLIQVNKMLYVNRENFNKFKNMRFSMVYSWIAIRSRIPKQFSF